MLETLLKGRVARPVLKGVLGSSYGVSQCNCFRSCVVGLNLLANAVTQCCEKTVESAVSEATRDHFSAATDARATANASTRGENHGANTGHSTA